MKAITHSELTKALMEAGKAYGVANKSACVFKHMHLIDTKAAINRAVHQCPFRQAHQALCCRHLRQGLLRWHPLFHVRAMRRALTNIENSPLAGADDNDAIVVDTASPIVVASDKSKGQLLRLAGSNCQLAFNQSGHHVPTSPTLLPLPT